MKRYLCLDIGDRRMGVAVSDPFNSYALPVQTIFRKNLKTDLGKVAELVKERCVTDIVCGLPVNFDGTPSIQTQKAQFFIDKLRSEYGYTVHTVDERCSTVEAEEVLISQGKSRQERKTVVDSLAAATILTGFLNEINKGNEKGDDNMSDKEKKTCSCGCEEEHVHTEACDCGGDCDCGCDCCGEPEPVELTTDDGKKLKFYFIDTIEYNGKKYSAFEPAEEIEGLEEDDVLIFELSGDDEETADLLPVEDDAILDAVFEELCRKLDEEDMAAEAESLE